MRGKDSQIETNKNIVRDFHDLRTIRPPATARKRSSSRDRVHQAVPDLQGHAEAVDRRGRPGRGPQPHGAGNGQRGLAMIDIFRAQNGKIVEHWDMLQEVPE